MTREEAIEVLKKKVEYLESDKRFKAAVETLIPELTESEDERIRKFLIYLVSTMNWRVNWPEDKVKEEKVKCIAWLEKQKEQKPILKFKVGDKIHLIDGTSPNYEDDCITISEIGTINYIGEFKEGYVPIKEQDKWELVKEPKPAEWSEEDEENINSICSYLDSYCRYHEKDGYGVEECKIRKDWLKSLRPSWKPSEDELAKKHLEGYCMGREDTMREMKDFIESHFNTNKAREGEDLTDLYRKEYAQPFPIMPTPPSGWGCDGTHCTNPQMDCINCPRKTTGGMFNTTSGTSTLKAEG